jgi:hypothetical protein
MKRYVPQPKNEPKRKAVDVSRRQALRKGAKLAYVVPVVLSGITLSEAKLNGVSGCDTLLTDMCEGW